MRVGVILPLGDESVRHEPHRYADIRALAIAAEASGLDSIWVYDHLLAGSTEDAEASPWEAWTMMSALAEATSRVSIGALVLCTAFRSPGMLARMADTLQEVSGDRLVLGLGAGWHEPEFRAFGLPFDHRVGRFAEALQIITTMLRAERATLNGRYVQVDDAPIRPRPDRKPPTILVAGVRPRMLKLTAQYADSWNLAWFGHPNDRFRNANQALTDACRAVGRDPATLARTVGVQVAGPDARDANRDPERVIHGGPDEIADAIAAWESEGVSELICSVSPADLAGLELVAQATAAYRRR